jgi:RHS repeat-associated protein
VVVSGTLAGEPSDETRYYYNAATARLDSIVSTAGTATIARARWTYDRGGRVTEQRVAAGTGTGTALGLRYTWGLGTVDLVGVRDAGGNQYYVVQDKLGSVRGLYRQDGTWWMRQSFAPYGGLLTRDTTTVGASVPLRYAWTGREYDAETGWYYFRARYYDPQQRRFVQEDPVGYAGGMNLYAYVEGRPLGATDPSGLMMEADVPDYGGDGREPWYRQFGSTYADFSLAREEAEYETWVAAGGQIENGKRVLGYIATYSNGDTRAITREQYLAYAGRVEVGPLEPVSTLQAVPGERPAPGTPVFLGDNITRNGRVAAIIDKVFDAFYIEGENIGPVYLNLKKVFEKPQSGVSKFLFGRRTNLRYSGSIESIWYGWKVDIDGYINRYSGEGAFIVQPWTD